MPVDFHTYFLSSSPPGFDLESYSSEHFLKQDGFGLCRQRANSDKLISGKTMYGCYEQPGSILSNVEITSLTSATNAKRIVSWNRSYENVPAISYVKSSDDDDDDNVSVTKVGKKKVSFADEIGLALEDVRVMEDSSDVPPIFQPDLIARLSLGSATPLCLETVNYAINFPQPLSDYLALRDKIERNNVSLETAIVRSSSVMGTVLVKNLAYEKRVLIRLTCNNWEAHDDIIATYSSTNGSQNPSSYDVFEFEIGFPTAEKDVSKIYFAICYKAGYEQFWDNNDGENYEIISLANVVGSSSLNGSDAKIFSLAPEHSWADFSIWDGISPCDPYW